MEEISEQILSCVKRALEKTLGTTGMAATLYMLDSRHALGQKQMVDAKKLPFALRSLFDLGSVVLLKGIEDQLHSSNPKRDIARASIEEFAKQINDVVYAVEQGLGRSASADLGRG